MFHIKSNKDFREVFAPHLEPLGFEYRNSVFSRIPENEPAVWFVAYVEERVGMLTDLISIDVRVKVEPLCAVHWYSKEAIVQGQYIAPLRFRQGKSEIGFPEYHVGDDAGRRTEIQSLGEYCAEEIFPAFQEFSLRGAMATRRAIDFMGPRGMSPMETLAARYDNVFANIWLGDLEQALFYARGLAEHNKTVCDEARGDIERFLPCSTKAERERYLARCDEDERTWNNRITKMEQGDMAEMLEFIRQAIEENRKRLKPWLRK